MKIQAGTPHPTMPHWQVEKVAHSPNYPKMIKYQWVRRDGVRGQLQRWVRNLFPPDVVHTEKYSIVGMNSELIRRDKDIPLGPDNLELKTIRYQSGIINYNEHPQGELMVWPERVQ